MNLKPTNKIPLGIVPQELNILVATVMQYGATKYAKDNWKELLPDKNKVETADEYLNAFYRHLYKAQRGEICDEESGLPHLNHALFNFFCYTYFNTEPEYYNFILHQ